MDTSKSDPAAKAKKHTFIGRSFKALALTVMAILLFVLGTVMMVYSPWFQDSLRLKLVELLNADPDVEFKLGSFRLEWPLNLEVGDVLMVSHGDTLLRAGNLRADVEMLPLLDGTVLLNRAKLVDGRYQIGAADSASCKVIKAAEARLDRSTVKLSSMDIHVTSADLKSGFVDMWINPADTFPASPPSESSPMNIVVDKLTYTDLTFRLKLMPTIDTLSTTISQGSMSDARIDVLNQTVDIARFSGVKMDARYIMPDSAQIAACQVITGPPSDSAPWTVRVAKMKIDDSHAVYTTHGLKPLPGLDLSYIEVSDISLEVDSFYNRAAAVRLPFAVSGHERCGIDLSADGQLEIDSVGLGFKHFALDTRTGTDLRFSGYMGTENELTTPDVPLRLILDGKMSVADINTMFSDFKPYFAGLRPGSDIDAGITVGGRSGALDISRLNILVDNHITLYAHGLLKDVFDDKGMSGDLTFDGTITDVSNWTKDLLAGTGVLIPSMTLGGRATFDHGNYTGDIKARTGGGDLALKGAFNGNREKYNIDLTTNSFPVNAFMPALGVGRVTGKIVASGNGFNFFKPSTAVEADIDLASVEYLKKSYSDITLTAGLEQGQASIDLNSNNPGLDAHVTAEGNLDGHNYVWNVTLDSDELDLAALGLSDTPATVTADLDLSADLTADLRNVDATLVLRNLVYSTPESTLEIDDSKVVLNATDSVTNLVARNRDLYAYYSSPLPFDSVMGRVTRVENVLTAQFTNRRINIPELQQAIMPFRLNIDAGNDNALSAMLAESDIDFGHAYIETSNDTSLFLTAAVTDFRSGDLRLDTINFDIRQRGNRLEYMATVNNRPGTFDQWAHVDLDGYFETGKLGINLQQADIQGKRGFDLGTTVTFNRDSTMTLRIDPLDPMINYRKWKVNAENFIKYDFRHRHLDADVRMKSDISSIALYTEHANDTTIAAHGADEDLILQLFDIQIQDWIALNPFAPPMKGNLSAGMRINWEDTYLSGNGTVALTDFVYGKEKVGDFRADIDLITGKDGLIRTTTDLWVNGEKTMTLSGALNDSTRTSPFNLDFKMIHFPLATANAFLPGVAKLGGSLNGSMDISGDASNPILNGSLAFEDATVNVTMLGSTLSLTSDTIPVKDNIVRLSDFFIKGVNENPLNINGTVDITSLANPKINLDLTADNMQIVNTNRAPKGADVYGKAFVSLDSRVRGDLRVLNVNADLDILPGTNVTYIMADGTAAIENQANSEMVKFINFNDTAAVAAADSLVVSGTLLNLNASLNINTGTIINVDLGANVQDRVQLKGSGRLNYVSSPVGDGRLTGRYTLSGGFFKYSPPFISNLDFDISEGSYVDFSGDMTNPRLNLKAIEKMRANVSQSGQNSRLIYFDIIVSVTGTPANMDVGFNLQTDDDITVANELASMSPTQRASEAMNLLLYNTYTGGSTTATSNLTGNPLFSFLTNKFNSWLANNVRGVDISLGIDQYNQTTDGSTSTTTSYSYQVSKSLFNDRFKIVVGGNYSSDSNADENVAENLINDVSFEYYLNNERTMYIRLFRHTGYESILEGEITQTGVGFVYRKKISRISDMFIPRKFRKKTIPTDDKP